MGDVASEKALGLRLQKARQVAGLTQQELCQRSGLSYSTLAKIERGAIKSPSIFTVQQIASVLGMGVDELLGVASTQKPQKKISKSGISFVYFDINGCLVRFFHRAFSKVAEDVGVPPDLVESTFWHYNDEVCRGDISLEEFNTLLAQQFEVATFDWVAYYLDAVDPIIETQALLEWASEHYRIGLLSNIMPGTISKMIEKQLIPQIDFDTIIDSSEVHAIKPEAAIYDTATERAGVDPAQILLIDDSRANLMAAERKGWRVMWFDDYRPTESVEKARKTLAF